VLRLLKQVLQRIIWTSVVAMLALLGWSVTALAEDTKPQKGNLDAGGALSVELCYMTLRDKSSDNDRGEFYGGMRSDLRMGTGRIVFKPIPGLKEIAEAAPFYIPGQRISLQSVNERSEKAFLKEIKAFADRSAGNIVFYVHGYNISFEKGCRQAAIFQQTLGRRHRVILFSWPADGDILKYTRDEADAIWSAHPMATCLKGVVQAVGRGKVDLVAHSLGARCVATAMIQMGCTPPASPSLGQDSLHGSLSAASIHMGGGVLNMLK